MKWWMKAALITAFICACLTWLRVQACEVMGETCRFDKPGSPWETMTPAEYSNCEECKAAIEDTMAKFPRYYRNLRCENCDCDQNQGNDNSQEGTSNGEPSRDSSISEQAVQQAADEKERQANLAKEQKFKENKQDALNQLKGVAGDSEESAKIKGSESVDRDPNGPAENAKSRGRGGFDEASTGAKPKTLKAPPASDPVEEKLKTLKIEIKRYKTDLVKKKKKIQDLNTQITQLAAE